MLAASLALGTALVIAAPSTANAQTIVSQATGRLVTTALLSSTVLDSLVTLKGAQAINTTGTADVIANTPVNAAAVGGLVGLTAGPNNLPVFGFLGVVRLNAVGQYGRANSDGSSVAFSGSVGSAPGLIGVNDVASGPGFGAPTEGNAAEIEVGTAELLGGPDQVTVDATLETPAASAQQTSAGAQSGQYRIDEVSVIVGGTIVATPVSTISSALEPVAIALQVQGINLPNPFGIGSRLELTSADLQAAGLGADLNALPVDTDLTKFIPQAVSLKITKLTNDFLTAADTAASGSAALKLLVANTRAVVAPVLAGLGSPFQGQFGIALGNLAQLIVNHESVVNGTFTKTALRLGLGSNGSLAAVDLASAAVGPNAGPAVTPTASPTGAATGAATGSGAVGGNGNGAAGSSATLAHTGLPIQTQLMPWGAASFLVLAAGLGLYAVSARRRKRSVPRGR